MNNKQKAKIILRILNKTYPKVAPGDNPMSYKEDTVTAEDLANSFREQYEAFKESYKKVAET